MVSKEITTRLEKYSTKLGVPAIDLITEYETLTATFAEKGLKGRKLEREALNSLTNKYKRKYGNFARSSGEMYEGWIDGATTLRDQTQEKVRRTNRVIAQDGRSMAMMNGLIDEAGTPMDDRPNIFGRKNLNFGKPLSNSDPAYIRTLYGVGRKKGEEEFFGFSLTCFGQVAEKMSFRTNIPCEFIARAGDGNKLFATNITQFHPVKDTDWDQDALYEELVIDGSELEARMSTTVWDDKDVRIQASVITLNPEPINEQGDRVMSVSDLSMDLDQTYSCFIPAFVNVGFTQDQEIILIARVREYKGKPAMTAYGIYALPTLFAPSVGDIAAVEESISVGWIDPEDDEEL